YRELLHVRISHSRIVDPAKTSELEIGVVRVGGWRRQRIDTKTEIGEITYADSRIHQIEHRLIDRRVCLLRQEQRQVLKYLIVEDSVSPSDDHAPAAGRVIRESDARLKLLESRSGPVQVARSYRLRPRVVELLEDPHRAVLCLIDEQANV